MQALILAGGKGTRLRPLTLNTPKPVVPVLNRPFLLFQIDILRLAGITDIILSLNYQPDKIEEQLGDGSEYGVKLRYLIEPEPLGTGGAFGFARDLINETTVVLNGDILTNLNVSEMARQHQGKQAEATIFLTPVEDPSAYGLVETDENLRVSRFLEKPKPDEIEKLPTRNINAGVYILEPSVFELIPEGQACSFEYDVFPALLQRQKGFQKGFYAYIDRKSYWRDIGNPRSYLMAHSDFLAGNIDGFPLPVAGDGDHKEQIDEVSIVGEGCTLAPGVRIIRSVLGQGVRLEENAIVENSVIWPEAQVGRSSVIRDSFLGRKCRIGDNIVIENGSVLGDDASVGN